MAAPDQPRPLPTTCADLPPLVSSFIDAFIDFSIGGLFFPSSPPPSPEEAAAEEATSLPAPSRLVAIGDLHGDLPKAIQSLSLAGLVEPGSLRWSGGSSVAVQLGDILDRGGDELRLLYLLRRLQMEASSSGGAFLSILGNHEIMNISQDFRYVTRAGLEEFKSWAKWYRSGLAMKKRCSELPLPKDPFKGVPKSFPGVKMEYWEGFHARIAALKPDGPITNRFLSDNRTVLIVGESVFVHGGLLERHVRYGLERINEEVRDWIKGKTLHTPPSVCGQGAVVWLREFSDGENCDCSKLEEILKLIPGAKRLIMGHTIQKDGINAVCGTQAVRVDVGLSKGCGDGVPEVLEINGNGSEIRVLTADIGRVYDWRERKVKEERERKEGLAWLVRESNGLKEVETKA